MILSLPFELQLHILCHVPSVDLCNSASSVCTLWESIITDESFLRFWKYKAHHLYPKWANIMREIPQKWTRKRIPTYEWLCTSLETPIDVNRIASGFTGTGVVHNAVFPAVENESRVRYLNDYVGGFKNGRFHGFGIFVPTIILHTSVEIHDSIDLDYHIGKWKGGLQNGMGKSSWERGKCVHHGQYKNGLRHGRGVCVWNGGIAKYEGEFKQDSIWGQGTFQWPRGLISGSWKLNKQHGKSHVVWDAYGCRFEGTYKYGIRKCGVYTWRDGSMFIGEWDGNLREGNAEMRFPNGTIFKGIYKRDVREGEGTIEWTNGDVFKGNWEAGRRKGPGTLTLATGVRILQEWDEPLNTLYTNGEINRYPEDPKK